MMPLFSREKSSLKGRWRLETVQDMRSSSSNPVSCSETSIKIYGSKEEIRARKSPETVDAPGFAPDASIPVTLYGAAGRIRTADLILTKDALYLLSYSSILATKKGLEPSTSSVTGWRSNQLNYLALSRSRELKLAYYSKCGGKCQHPFPDFLAKISVPGGRQVCRPAFLTAPALRTTSRTAPSCR